MSLPVAPDPADLLPAGVQATATWTIPPDHGGMTGALLRRARIFATLGARPVRLLTFDPEMDAVATRADLVARGELGPGVSLHHLWEDVRALPDAAMGRTRLGRNAPRPPEDGPDLVTEQDGDGEVRRQWVLRPDGSVAVLYDRTALLSVTLYTRAGRPARRWRSPAGFHRWWVDQVLPPGPAFLVVDSKALVQHFAGLNRPGTTTVHVVHGAHLSSRAAGPHGPLVPTREAMVAHLDDYDAVVLLTAAQRADLVERVGVREHLSVIPNSTDLPVRTDAPTDAPPSGRDPYAGAVLASLTARKRLSHALRAVNRARREGLPVRLDVYGDGPLRDELEQRAARVPGVRLHGFVPDAADQLVEASFLLLTSLREGLPLVLAEAMSRGCVPIAYDIRYGPRDVITDGVDGFLVPPGDIAALASAISRWVRMDETERHAVREAARLTARRFSDPAVLARWGETLQQAAERRRRRDRRAVGGR